MPRRCIFCGGKGLTVEDALPKWLSEAVIPPGIMARMEQSDWQPKNPANQSSWHARTIDRRIRQVCQACNNGWMSDLEKDAKPYLIWMMLGYSITLSPQAQRLVAIWATKTAIMLQYTRPARPVHPHYLQWLYTKKEPPPDVWIGLSGYATDDINPAVQVHDRLLQVPRSGPPPLDDRDAVFTVIRIFRLVLQVWIWTDPPTKDVSVAYPFRLTKFTVPIWPTNVFNCAWPPGAVLDVRGFSRLVSSGE